MKTIGIFCGGYSSEFGISIKSAETIQKNFPSEYSTLKIIVKKKDGRSKLMKNLLILISTP